MLGPLAPGQLGPLAAALSSPFTPAAYSPKVWLTASLGVYKDTALSTPATADGDLVAGWADQSGNGNNVTQATSGKRPILKLASNGIGGVAALSFVGNTKFMASAAFSAGLSQPSTIYAVFKFASVGNINNVLTDGIDSTHRHTLFSEAISAKYRMVAGNNLSNNVVADTSSHVESAIFNGASSQAWVDNTSVISGDAGAQSLTGLVVGGLFSSAASSDGLIAEIIVYNAAHTTAQRTNVQNYLKTKYGTP